MTKEKYAHIHEGALENISSLMFDVEHSMPVDHPVRKQIYKARCEIGTAITMNRENKDWPQERWVPIVPCDSSQQREF